jgi:hypothetical protein
MLDGQHRFEVAQKLKRPVHYIINQHNMNIHNVAKVNSIRGEMEILADFVSCYATAGNDNYKKIKNSMTTYNVAIGLCLILLTYGNYKRRLRI